MRERARSFVTTLTVSPASPGGVARENVVGGHLTDNYYIMPHEDSARPSASPRPQFDDSILFRNPHEIRTIRTLSHVSHTPPVSPVSHD